ncbi:hypothetical protein DL766_007471 [Monosporascus sp. MC13-8B]|uniref:C2H2-type domain-containing protein n=1 Tax=Monosporascus cannonballus TaxID=155416 RepID=A0ABY0GXE0_9PEZI|nr:hypothetical protein DL762_009585 [Monosporascus cannonballus]RYO82038.1 hypothetical protein DL763_008370 [Monosporascus cannonballus]RYP23762.1 hypothetical protein DL766_007471 [Monosporascus sp. MC13-8B]
MCAPVQFRYLCGCVEDVKFECASAHRGDRHKDQEPMITPLRELCHNCDTLTGDMVGMSSPVRSGSHADSGSECDSHALRERDVNLPSKMPPTTLSSGL